MIPEIEIKSKEDIKAFQETKLQDLLKYLSEKSPYYSEMFRENNIDINTFVPSPDKPFGPDRYEEILIDFNNLKVGQIIDIYAGSNIKNVKNFNAKKIVIKQ